LVNDDIEGGPKASADGSLLYPGFSGSAMMTLIQAKLLLASFKGGPSTLVTLAMSGTADVLDLYFRAESAARGVAVTSRLLPFGTLAQYLLAGPADNEGTEVIVLTPWDFVPECDWRSGLPRQLTERDTLMKGAERLAAAIAARPAARLFYLPAPVPPLLASTAENCRLAADLGALTAGLGAYSLDSAWFSLASYLANGCPFGGTALPAAGVALAELLLAPPPLTHKVVATDADNTLWAGIVGEDGVDGVSAEPAGLGYRHFVYQTLLLRLKAAGIVLVIISRNDSDAVRAALGNGRMQVTAEDFVSIHAGYGLKSESLRAVAAELGLGLDSVVFVDDNPVEVAEVAAILPQTTCLSFPRSEDELPAFAKRLAELFDRSTVTGEDRERTVLYRRRLASLPHRDGTGVRQFLAGLEMRLIIRDRSAGDHQRPLQLINKTNQFNINGERLTDKELDDILSQGGRLYSVQLDDRTGSHGEILACLIEPDGRVRSLVMSCRVLERRVEFAFVAWLANAMCQPLLFAVKPTEQNEPARHFFEDPAFLAGSPDWQMSSGAFLAAHADDLALFSINPP